MRPWIGALALLLVACESSTKTTKPVVGPTSAPEDPQYIDFAAQASADGQKVAFLSRRVDGVYRVYLYSETAEPKLYPLSKGIPLETGTQELATALSDDGKWIVTWRLGAEKNELLLNSFDGLQQKTLALPSDQKLRELSLAPSAKPFFAYTERASGVDTIHVYSFSLTGTPELTVEGTFSGESNPQFAVSGSDLYVFTRKNTNAGNAVVQFRKWTATNQWNLNASSLALAANDGNGPSSASALGLLYGKNLDSVRLKAKLGTFSDRPEGYQVNVGVAQEAQQFQAFSSSVFNTSAPAYLANQPLTLGGISATADGAYVLFTGYDAWFCKTKTQSSNVLQLIRVSDGAVLPILVTRTSATLPWTGLVSEPCSYFDQSSFPVNLDFDLSISNAQILSVTDNRVLILYETKISGDREIRRVSLDVSDWTAKTYANPIFTDVSANPKP